MGRVPLSVKQRFLAAVLSAVTMVGAAGASTLAYAQAASTEESHIGAIRIEGNQRVEADTIRTYLGVHEGDVFTPASIDKALKNLFATGFFADVKLLRSGNDLVVHVTENPVISRVAFEGNSRIETKDLEKEVELKARSVYSRAKVQADVQRILNIYRKSGRYTATVTPKIIKQPQNRADLVFEIVEGQVARVEKISFIGNNSFSTNELLEAIRTSESRWWRFLTDSDKYDPDKLQYDQELLRRYYTSQGYADFQVKSAQAELAPDKSAFYLTFVLDEGPKYTLSKVDVSSELKGAEKPNLDGVITNKAGQIYDSTKVDDSIEAMTKELGNHGYAFVDIQPKLTRDRAAHTVVLTYDIKPGPRVYVERVNINGNVRTLDEVVRREFRLSEGDPYNAALLARTEQRLNNLGFFEKVKINTEPGSAPDKTVITTDVQEKSTGEINLGAGFSSTDGPLANVGFKETNLLGRGQEIKANVTYAALRKQADFGFTEPYFLDRELSAGFDIYRSVVNYDTRNNSYSFSAVDAYDVDSKGIVLRMGYALSERLNHSIYYSLRYSDITNVAPLASLYIRNQAGINTNSAIGHTFTYDSRNNKFDPTNGYYLKLTQELAGVGGNSRYIKHDARTNYYYPWAKNWVFNIGGGAGDIYGYSNRDINISDRFFMGGELVRGFANFGLGPRDVATRDALGGDMYYFGSVEQRFPLGLPEDLGILGALFVDAGSLWHLNSGGPGIQDSNTLRMGAGFGISWKSPFGPVRIDFAAPILKERFDENQLVRFSFGARF